MSDEQKYRIEVRPEHPEIGGIYVHRDDDGLWVVEWFGGPRSGQLVTERRFEDMEEACREAKRASLEHFPKKAPQ